MTDLTLPVPDKKSLFEIWLEISTFHKSIIVISTIIVIIFTIFVIWSIFKKKK